MSLPGLASGTSGPTGFEPGMFKTEDENNAAAKVKTEKDKHADGGKVLTAILKFNYIPLTRLIFCLYPQPKKKKKDKKKHKHKHKHKHNKEKERDKEREESKEKKDPNVSRLMSIEDAPETLSSADTSSNSNQTFMEHTSTM